MSRRAARCALFLPILVCAIAARADVDVEVRNADAVTGTISPATEIETIRFRVPEGAAISVKAKAAKKGPELHLVLRDESGAQLQTADGRAASIKGVLATSSGLYSAEVTSRNGTSTGDYSFGVTWKSPASATATLDLAPGAESTVAFAAESGAKATFSVKKAKRSQATPSLVSLTNPDASGATLSGASASIVLGATGDYVLAYRNSGATSGALVATVKLKAPKPAKRKIALTTKVIGAGDPLGDVAFAAVIGPAGGGVSVPLLGAGQPGAAISGASVSIPAGALPSGTAIIVGTAPLLTPPSPNVGAGPTVFFGPDGTQFGKLDATKSAAITIPFDPAFTSKTAQLEMYTRDAKGRITLVPGPYTFDLVHHTITAATSHFSSFRAAGLDATPAATMVTLVNAANVEDMCDSNDFTVGGPLLFVAQGNMRVVGAVCIESGPATLATWVGGGGLTADGTARTAFQFVDDVTSVATQTDGTLYVATIRQIFSVDLSGAVNRIAGTGASGDGGDGGGATLATFTSIADIAIDADGVVMVADAGAHRLRRIDTGGTISSFDVVGVPGFTSSELTSFAGPQSVMFAPSGGVYVADGGRIRHFDPFRSPTPIDQTVAGDAGGALGSSGDGGPPLLARFEGIAGIAKYTDLANPTHDIILVADSVDHTVRLVNLTLDVVTLQAGTHGTPGFSGDSSPVPGALNAPTTALGIGTVLTIADTGNGKVRRVFLP